MVVELGEWKDIDMKELKGKRKKWMKCEKKKWKEKESEGEEKEEGGKRIIRFEEDMLNMVELKRKKGKGMRIEIIEEGKVLKEKIRDNIFRKKEKVEIGEVDIVEVKREWKGKNERERMDGSMIKNGVMDRLVYCGIIRSMEKGKIIRIRVWIKEDRKKGIGEEDIEEEKRKIENMLGVDNRLNVI